MFAFNVLCLFYYFRFHFQETNNLIVSTDASLALPDGAIHFTPHENNKSKTTTQF